MMFWVSLGMPLRMRRRHVISHISDAKSATFGGPQGCLEAIVDFLWLFVGSVCDLGISQSFVGSPRRPQGIPPAILGCLEQGWNPLEGKWGYQHTPFTITQWGVQ